MRSSAFVLLIPLSLAALACSKDAKAPPPSAVPHTALAPTVAAKPPATAASAGSSALDRPRPRRLEYRRLRTALERYRHIASTGGWARVPDGPVVHPGDRVPRAYLTMLASRLEAEGDLAPGAAPPPAPRPAVAQALPPAGGPAADAAAPAEAEVVYGPDLAGAVRRFQGRLGLEVDGNVGSRTLEAMNVPALERIRQIELNMERWRSLPVELAPRRLEVNIPAFMLRVVDDGHTVATMKVVVGTTHAATPAFNEDMTYVVLNPYWNVPRSIMRHEIAPAAARDPGYLPSHRYEVVDGWGGKGARRVDPASIDWASVAAGGSFRYRVRQLPGPGNALGRIKFMLPNSYNVYLHDTPSESLFDRAQRSFSHGCVRVQHPLDLARWVFRDDPAWPPDRLASAVASGRRKWIVLPQPIPVYLLYRTAWVDGDGTTHFRNDLYGRDRKLARALDSRLQS